MAFVALKKGCLICGGDVRGNYESGFFCAACNVLFRAEHLKLNREKIRRMIQKKEIDELFSAKPALPAGVRHYARHYAPGQGPGPEQGEHEPHRKIIAHFLASRRGTMVHASNCFFAKNIKKENMLMFSSVRDALERGYRKCGCVR